MGKLALEHRSASLFMVASVMVLGSAFCPMARGEAQYTLTELPNLGGPVVVEGLNNEGQVVGSGSLPNGNYHAFVWSQSAGMQDLGTFSGDVDSNAKSINDSGQIAGTSVGADTPIQTFLWQSGTGLVNIGANAVVTAQPSTITAQGQIVGVAGVNLSSNFGFVYSSRYGLNAVTINSMPVQEVDAANNNGQMVVAPAGSIGTSNEVLLSPGQAPVEITGQNLIGTVGLAMNNKGTVVGYAQVDGATASHAFVWSETTGLIDLTPTLQGYDFALAQAVNNEGQVVGFADFQRGQDTAFLYENGTFYDLSTLLGDSGAGWTDLRAEAINDNGQIAGDGFFDGQEESFLLTPNETTGTPEPGTLGLLALGMVMMMRRRDGGTS